MKNLISIIITFCLFSFQLYAQQMTVSGRVSDEADIELVGVNIIVKGTNKATVSDLEGKFSLSVKKGDVLVFSYISYETKEVLIKDQSVLNVSLEPKVSELDEIVVVGYGTQKKESVVGAISSVKADELKQSASANLSNAIAGRISGVMTKMVSGRPGADDSKIYVRGLATMNDASPLILVDGVERSFDQIDPEDIESFSVMKDASATAVYGVRGANGVILVTTKRGMKNKPVVSLNTSVAVQSPIRLAKPLDAYNFALLKNEAIRNDGGNLNAYDYSSEEDLQHYLLGDSPFTHPNNDLLDMFLKKYTPQAQVNFNVRGGTDFVKYFVSAGFLYQDGIYKQYDNTDYSTNANYKRVNLRSNLDFTVTKTTQISVDLSTSLRSRHNIGMKNRLSYDSGPESNNLFEVLMRQPANYMTLKNPDGTYGAGSMDPVGSGMRNPLQIIERGGYYHVNNDVLEGNFKLNQKLDFVTKGLSFKAMAGITAFESSSQTLTECPYTIRYTKFGEYDRSIMTEEVLPSLTTQTLNDYQRIYLEASFNYARDFGPHKVTALALYNQTQYFSKAAVPSGYLGFVGRLTYGFKNKYLGEINMGYNGSNQFAEGHRYALFPAFSAGWVISEEGFWKENVPFIDFFKIRGSYGEVGNDKLGGQAYLYQHVYNPGNANFGNYNFGTTPQGLNGYTEGRLGNELVTWERARKSNVGLDLRLLKGKLTLSADYFREDRRNILLTNQSIPNVLGIGLPPENIGKVRNQGGEFELGYTNNAGKFNYYVKGNVSYARNKILFKGESPQLYDWMATTGQSLGQHFGLVSLGMFKSQEEIDKAPKQFGDVKIGDLKYKDLNDDGVIDGYDECPIGYSNVPRIQFGLSAGFEWKGIDFSMLWQGAAQFSAYFAYGAVWEFMDGGNVQEMHLNRFNPEDPSSWDTATYPRLHNGNFPNNHRKSDFWLKKGDYLRLKNLEIGYTFPKTMLSKVGISRLRAFVSGTNLLTFDYVKNFDPETEQERGYNYPQMAQYTLGFNFQF